MRIMISLVGEQPLPNVLPLRHYAPVRVLLVHTERTRKLATRIGDVIRDSRDSIHVEEPFCETDPYLVNDTKAKLAAYLARRGFEGEELIFNLTGGTKTMGYAALELARQYKARAFYYQTEDNQSLIHPYRFENETMIVEAPVPIEETLLLNDHLRLYVGSVEPTCKFNDVFEKTVYEALKAAETPQFEVMPPVRLSGVNSTVEVDGIVRLGNQIAVLEIKRKAGKRSIDQLNSATHPLMLGTYTRKVLVSSVPLEGNNPDLAEAYRIHTIVLQSGGGEDLSLADKEGLVREVKSVFGRG